MKHCYLLSVVIFLLFRNLSAQTSGNGWIMYAQQYLKIKITQDAVYRVDSTTLSNSLAGIGVSLATIDPRNFQIFHNGVEEYIWVEGENDGLFHGADYIEFYGKRNDGAMDSSLYGGSANQLNPYFSMYNDTAVYFLTWNTSVSNRRLVNPNDTNFSGYTPANYFTNKEVFVGDDLFLPGVTASFGITDPEFIPSEGWYDSYISYGTNTTRVWNTANAYGAGPAAKLNFRIGTHSDDWITPMDNTVRIQFQSTQFDTTYDGYAVADYNFTTPATSLAATTPFTISSINLNGSNSSGLVAIAYATITYPHTFDMEGRTRFAGYLPDNTSGSKSFVEFMNVGGSGTVRIYDLYNYHRIDAVSTAGIHRALVLNGNGSEKSFLVNSESAVMQVTTLTPVNGTGTFTDFPSQAADSVFIIVTHKLLWNVGLDYKSYRSSAAGGMRNVILADIHELYDQFAWGIGQHPLAIRNFADFMIQTFPSAPAHLLLIGKSIYPDQARSATNQWQNLVPTMGYPSCDNSLTAGLDGISWKSAIPTGRIAARDSAQARWYLDKVIDYENNVPDEWMKHVLHFGGGTATGEQQLYKNYLNSYRDTIHDIYFGGQVQSYFKSSSSPIQINQSDSLRERIEAGVSIMTFFGHASGTGFDQSIDDPASYNNVDRYPLLIANSCYAGDIHSMGISSSEAFTLLDQRGTIGYIATVSVGLPYSLNAYSGRLYQAISKNRYGRSIGECMQYAIDSSQALDPFSLSLKATCYEMTLQGDPSIVINSFEKPDYMITNNDVWFDQETQPDSITLYAKITNIGRATRDTFFVQLLREFPNGDSAVFLKPMPAPGFRDTISFTFPVNQQTGIGLNSFRIWLDYLNGVSELEDFSNNVTSEIDLLIRGSAIVPVYPYAFAVIPDDTITLKASTVNALEPARQYRFEIDTTDQYDSPFLQVYTVNAPGGVLTWKPQLLVNDSMVYFWRVTPDSLSPADALMWRESSFQYINNKTGWGQDHIFQFTNDGYQFVQLNRPGRNFIFVNDIKTLFVKNGRYASYSDSIGIPWNESYYKINGSTMHIFSCVAGPGWNGLSVAVFDPVSGVPWNHSSPNTGWDPTYNYFNCVGGGTFPQDLNAFDFKDSTTSQAFISSFINDIPNGYYVLVYSQHYNYYTHPPYIASLQNAFLSFGATVLGNNMVADSLPFIAFGVKGGSGTEVIGATPQSVITFQDTITTNWQQGFIASPVIGPAVSWESFHWKQHEVEQPDYDSVYVEIWGIQSNGTRTLLYTAAEDSTNINNLGSLVNASQYPNIQLIAHMKDDTSRTPPQLERWHVLYTPVPDVAVNPPVNFTFYNDTLQEGDQVKMTVAIQNLTPWPMPDTLLIDYWIIDEDRVKHPLQEKLRAPVLNGFVMFIDTIADSTLGYPGLNELWLEVNPVGDLNSQPEQYHFNNLVMMQFFVNSDRTNPLLDVTFDGVHILNGDIVSAKPSVLVTLKDENLFLALNDTGDFKVFLKRPSDAVAQPVSWGPEMVFTPASLPNNSCKILFMPACPEDGTYELIVQAKDRSNNQSGMIDYNITFEVINRPTITNVMNYPNPFTTSTRFVFTLTGSVVPETFSIQIMTITGKVVREIDKDELGDLHIGRNITTYAWDGRDEFGDRLANGIYLYRIITRLDGNEVEHRDSGADPYITKGWGKMYLMR